MNAPELIENRIYALPKLHTRVFQNEEYDIYLQDNTHFSENKQEQIELETVLTRMLSPNSFVAKEVTTHTPTLPKEVQKTIYTHAQEYTHNKAALREQASLLTTINDYEIHLHPQTRFRYHHFREEDVFVNVAEAHTNVFTFNKKHSYMQHVHILFEWQEAQRHLPFR